MNLSIASEIQSDQDKGREKYRRVLGDMDEVTDYEWAYCISDNSMRSLKGSPEERRECLIRVASLAVSAIEAIDRKAAKA